MIDPPIRLLHFVFLYVIMIMPNKKKMAFVDLTNYRDWPMGGMLEYELSILPTLTEKYDVDIWGVSVDGKVNQSIEINNKTYPIYIWGNVITKTRIVPNYWRGLYLYKLRNIFPRDYAVVYVHTGSCAVALNYMVDRERTKLIYHQHGLNHRDDYSLMSLIQRPLLDKAQKIADLVFVVSDKESVEKYAEEMAYKSKAKFIAIDSPISLSKFNKEAIALKIKDRKGKRPRKFIYTGRLTRFKNAMTMVEAFNMYIKQCDSGAVLEIAGKGEEYAPIKRLITEYGLDNNVKLLGAVAHDKIYELLENADIFLTASGGEGVSVSILEAFAAGVPVVCFEVSGLKKQVKDHYSGIIAKSHDKEGFFSAIKEAVRLKDDLVENCIREAARFDVSRIAGKICSEISAIC